MKELNRSSISRASKRWIKSALNRAHLLGIARHLQAELSERTSGSGSVGIFEAKFEHGSVQFSTEDEYSKRWFYPRYARGGIHERQVTLLLLDSIRNARVFVDIGANLGWYTCVAAKHLSSGSVFGFEMDDRCFGLLERNVALNNLTNTRVYNLAVSDRAGVETYERFGNRPSPTFCMDPARRSEKTSSVRSVRAIAMDDFFRDESVVPDVIKIDVEGAEEKVLEGMRATLAAHKPVLFLEIHPKSLKAFGSNATRLIKTLLEYGYRVYEIDSMRSQEAAGELRSLSDTSILANNTMLFLTTDR